MTASAPLPPEGPAHPRRPAPADEVRTGVSPDLLARAIVDHLHYTLARRPEHASRNDWYLALAYTVRAFATAHADWLAEVREAIEQVQQVRAKLKLRRRSGEPPLPGSAFSPQEEEPLEDDGRMTR